MKQIKYLAWLSTKGEKTEIKNGALYAGLVRNIPNKYKHLCDGNISGRAYCIISINISIIGEDMPDENSNFNP